MKGLQPGLQTQQRPGVHAAVPQIKVMSTALLQAVPLCALQCRSFNAIDGPRSHLADSLCLSSQEGHGLEALRQLEQQLPEPSDGDADSSETDSLHRPQDIMRAVLDEEGSDVGSDWSLTEGESVYQGDPLTEADRM